MNLTAIVVPQVIFKLYRMLIKKKHTKINAGNDDGSTISFYAIFKKGSVDHAVPTAGS
jgi:sulfur relay (sulfurtransferase) DsrC/TusE family protein